MPVDNTEQRIRSAEANIRKILGILMQIAVGGRVNSQNIVGVIPKDQGGTGSNAGSLAVFPKFINDSGVSLSNGAVVIFDPAGAREITTTTTAGHRLVAGAVSGSGSPYAAAAETPVMMIGYHTALFVTGAVAIGDYLKTSTVAGRAISAGVEPQAGIFAIALSSAAGPGDGTVAAFIFAGSMTRILEEITAKGDLLAAPGAGDLDPLAVGADGEVLTADSTQALGMKWEAVTTAAVTDIETHVDFGSVPVGMGYAP